MHTLSLCIKVYTNLNLRKQKDIILKNTYVISKLRGLGEKLGSEVKTDELKSNSVTVVTVDPLKNTSCKNYEVSGTSGLLKNKHREVFSWVRAECLSLAESNLWPVEMTEPKSVRVLNSVQKQR